MEFARLIYRMHERRADSACLLKLMHAGISSVHELWQPGTSLFKKIHTIQCTLLADERDRKIGSGN